MDHKPDVSVLRLMQHGAVMGQSTDGSSAQLIGGTQPDALSDFTEYGEPLFVSASLPNGVESIYLSGGNHSPGSATSSNTKTQTCAICGDRASGKHYGVHSCEGCKGFFKRTVRKDLHYACRDEKNCVIDRRQRNRCQYCRYQKCVEMGMKREAVQEERMGSVRDRPDVESTDSVPSRVPGQSAFIDMPIEKLRDAEIASEPVYETYQVSTDDLLGTFCQAAEKQLYTLVDWAKRIPFFIDLPIDDQVTLLRSGWNELLIAGFSHRSIGVQDAVLLATGFQVNRGSAHEAGIGSIFDRVQVELIAKMRDMKMDKTELGCLRAIVLYNPDAKGLVSVDSVERLREKVYAALDEYCRRGHPEEPGRFAKLLLRLPALRSIGLKCIEHLFFYKLVSDSHFDSFLIEMLDIPTTNPSPSVAEQTAPEEYV